MRDSWKYFQEKDTVAFGINGRSGASHAAFKEKYHFPFPLLVDADKRMCKAYNTDGLLMVKRTVYLIGKDGKIRFAERGMPTPSEVLAAVE